MQQDLDLLFRSNYLLIPKAILIYYTVYRQVLKGTCSKISVRSS